MGYDELWAVTARSGDMARILIRVLPFCLIAAVVLITACLLIRIHVFDAAPKLLTADDLKTRLDDIKWLLTLIVAVAGFFAVAQGAAAFFSAQTFTKQAEDAVKKIEKLAEDTERQYPMFAETEKARKEAYRVLEIAFSGEGLDWRSSMYESMPLENRQRILSVESFLSIDLVPHQVDTPGYVRKIRQFANFYASKFLYERPYLRSISELQRSEYYLNLACDVTDRRFDLVNDWALLYLEFYRKLDAAQEEGFIKRSRELSEESLRREPQQQRARYNLAVADAYQKQWESAVNRLREALQHDVWEFSRIDERRGVILYNLACALARMSYAKADESLDTSTGADARKEASESAARYTAECLLILAESAHIGRMRKKTVDDDYDLPAGDLNRLVTRGSTDVAGKLNELRGKLSLNAGQAEQPLKWWERVGRAWEAFKQ